MRDFFDGNVTHLPERVVDAARVTPARRDDGSVVTHALGVDEANAESQTDGVRLAVLSIMSWLPAACHLLAGGVMRRYRLDHAEHARIRAVLDARAGEA